MSREYRGVLLLFITSILFSSNILVAKFALGVIPPFTLAFFRWGTAFLIMMLFNGKEITSQFRHLREEWPHFLLLGITGMLICGGFVYQAAHTTSGTNIALIYALAPVLIILFSRVRFNEEMSPLQYAGSLLSFTGVIIIICRGTLHTLLDIDFTAGDLWVLTACISWAVYSLKQKSFQSKTTGTVRLSLVALFGSLTLLPITIGEHFAVGVNYSLFFFLLIVVVAVFPSLIAFRSYELCQHYLGAGKASLVLYITPVVNALLVYLFLGEKIEPFHLLGGITVLAGVYLTNRKRAVETAPSNE